MATDAGKLSPEPFVERYTTTPLAGAMPPMYTEQFTDVPAEIDAAWHETVVRVPSVVVPAEIEMEALLETPPALAVTVVVSAGAELLAFTENLADIAPAATATDEGTVTPVPVADTLATTPAGGAATFRVAVQVDDPPAAMLSGAQLSAESAGFLMASEAFFERPALVAVIAAV